MCEMRRRREKSKKKSKTLAVRCSNNKTPKTFLLGFPQQTSERYCFLFC